MNKTTSFHPALILVLWAKFLPVRSFIFCQNSTLYAYSGSTLIRETRVRGWCIFCAWNSNKSACIGKNHSYRVISRLHSLITSNKTYPAEATFAAAAAAAAAAASAHTSSIKWILSVRLACWTHFSTTLEANLCWDKAKTLPRTVEMIMVLSSCKKRKARSG